MLRQGLPIAIIAAFWMTFILIIFCFPTTPTPIAADMNYTCLVLGVVIFGSVAYYYCPRYGGRHWFTGPVATILDDRSDTGSGRSNITEAEIEKE